MFFYQVVEWLKFHSQDKQVENLKFEYKFMHNAMCLLIEL